MCQFEFDIQVGFSEADAARPAAGCHDRAAMPCMHAVELQIANYNELFSRTKDAIIYFSKILCITKHLS